jgi:hypothetical protein
LRADAVLNFILSSPILLIFHFTSIVLAVQIAQDASTLSPVGTRKMAKVKKQVAHPAAHVDNKQ